MSFDLTATSTVFLSRIGAVSWEDVTDWITEAEVFGYFDEAAVRLAELGLFVSRETQTLASGTSAYPMPADWLDSIHVSVNGQQCRPTSAAELLALDSLWPQTACEPSELPERYSMDAGPLGTITLYPQPVAVAELETIDHVIPAAISTAQTTAPIMSVVSDYFLYFALQRARGKESPYAMPEIAAAAASRVQLYEQILASYFGGLE